MREEARRHRVLLDLSAAALALLRDAKSELVKSTGRCNAVLDLHHLDERADGRTHDPNRIVALCGAHHHAAHRRARVIRGDAVSGFVFEHADGRAYGSSRVAAGLARVLASAEGALRSFGLGAHEARAMVDRIRSSVAEGASLDEVVHAALCAPHRPRAAEALSIDRAGSVCARGRSDAALELRSRRRS